MKGLGPATCRRLAAKGLKRVEDVLYFFPLHYQDMRNRKKLKDVHAGETVTVHVTVRNRRQRTSYPRRVPMTEVIASDDTGSVFVLWFNQPYLGKTLKTGMEVLLHGKAETGRHGLSMINPVFSILDPRQLLNEEPEIRPLYSSIDRVSNRFMQRLIRLCIRGVLPCRFELPEDVWEAKSLPEKRSCFEQIHFPTGKSDIRKLESGSSIWHQALAFEELFVFFAGVMAVRRAALNTPKDVLKVSQEEWDKLQAIPPFTLTHEQIRVLQGIYGEFASGKRLVRLIQGDVGSGKTVVALLSALPFVHRGSQVALIAPTELLAEQHFQTITGLLDNSDVRVELLTGSTRSAERRRILTGLESGALQFVVGTHALIQDSVVFNNLQFVIIDEQHRFGVEQRQRLVSKGSAPHILSLTATPIPRTLAMTLYGHYDYDAIKERPAGRKEVRTVAKKEKNAEEVYRFVHEMVKRKGLQAYFVYPLIEESEAMDLASATEQYERLQKEWFSDLKTSLVHGRVGTDERNRVMEAFKHGDVDILFSTTVIEVGVDVPNANIMVIENAERFGLSQLHQLRGRIGRGTEQSYCFLVVRSLKGEQAFRRVKIMEETTDGFRISEEDLKIRGPGEFLGTRQSGMPDFRVADLFRDRELVDQARRDAIHIVNEGRLDWLDRNQWDRRYGRSLV